MKAIIADIKTNKMVLMCEGGDFHTVRARKGSVIGQEIDFEPSSYKAFLSIPQVKIGLAAACVCFVLGTGVWGYYIPNEYIDIDINPSVEIVTNHINKVIKIEALNEDGKNILNNTNLENQNYDSAVGKIIEVACEKNYIKDNQENAVMVTVTSNNTSNNNYTSKVLKDKVEKVTNEKNSPTVIETNSIPVSKYKQAKEQNISPGKLLLLERLKEVKPEATIEDVKNEKVKDIIDNIKETRKEKIKNEQINKPKDEKALVKETVPNVAPTISPKRDNKLPERENKNNEKVFPNQKNNKQWIRPTPTPDLDENAKEYDRKGNHIIRNKVRERIKNKQNENP